jgi:uncharacterized protein YlaI
MVRLNFSRSIFDGTNRGYKLRAKSPITDAIVADEERNVHPNRLAFNPIGTYIIETSNRINSIQKRTFFIIP